MKSRTIGRIIGLVVLCTICTSAFARNGGFHVVAGAGYAINEVTTTEFPNDNVEEFSFKVGVGYELSRQWAFELSYQGMGDTELTMLDETQTTVDLSEQAFDISAVQLSALGKASNNHGELFYRIGVMQIMSETNYLVNAEACSVDDTLLGSISAEPLLNSCLRENDELAGVLGIGFDFYVYSSLMLRLEMEYIQGVDDYRAQAAYLGFRFNF